MNKILFTTFIWKNKSHKVRKSVLRLGLKSWLLKN